MHVMRYLVNKTSQRATCNSMIGAISMCQPVPAELAVTVNRRGTLAIAAFMCIEIKTKKEDEQRNEDTVLAM